MTEENSTPSFCQRKPDISYPCTWEYKVIGEDQQALTDIIVSTCAPEVPDIVLSNVSSSGKYFSLNATLTVKNEEIRLDIFDRLQKHPAVKMVI